MQYAGPQTPEAGSLLVQARGPSHPPLAAGGPQQGCPLSPHAPVAGVSCESAKSPGLTAMTGSPVKHEASVTRGSVEKSMFRLNHWRGSMVTRSVPPSKKVMSMPPICTMRCLQTGFSPGCAGSEVAGTRLSLMVTTAPNEKAVPAGQVDPSQVATPWRSTTWAKFDSLTSPSGSQ